MGRTIVITGAGSGLGRAMARRLARDGHRLVLLGRTVGKLDAVAQEIGQGAWSLACDVADPASVKAAFGEIARREGRIDVLINNAAVYEAFMIEDGTEEQIAAALDTNLAGTIHVSRAALPLLGRGSQVINVSSLTVAAPAVMLALYQTSKAGVERFTRTLREELAERGVRVTLLRAAGMIGEGTTWNQPMGVLQRFQEERRKRAINNPVSRFDSVAELLPWLIDLPDDVQLTELMIEGREA